MGQEYSKKLMELDYLYDIGLKRSEFKQVVAKCSSSKLKFDTDEEWLAAVNSVVASVRIDPLKYEIKKHSLAVSQMCPVCGNVAEPITLMKDRKAFYCKRHRAVTPAIVDED